MFLLYITVLLPVEVIKDERMNKPGGRLSLLSAS